MTLKSVVIMPTFKCKCLRLQYSMQFWNKIRTEIQRSK